MDKRYRKAVVVGNWKMNQTTEAVQQFAKELKPLLPKKLVRTDIGICATGVLIPTLGKALRKNKVRCGVGAQDVSQHQSGAYTSETSGTQLQDAGVKYVIIGHSERRQYHQETDEVVNEKVKAALQAGLTPIACVGETLEQRERGVTMEIVSYQTKVALSGIAPEDVCNVIVAYEPVWAIGTGKTATAEDAGAVCTGIRHLLRDILGAKLARRVVIQYGGSMNAKNARELLAQKDIDGGLIGGAALDPIAFSAVVEATQQ